MSQQKLDQAEQVQKDAQQQMSDAQHAQKDADNTLTALETIIDLTTQDKLPQDPLTDAFLPDLIPELRSAPPRVKSKLETLSRTLFDCQTKMLSRMAFFNDQTKRIKDFLKRDDIEPEIQAEAEVMCEQSAGLDLR